MAIQTGEALQTSEYRDFNNLSVLHGLHEIIAGLDSRRREEMLDTLARLELPVYTAPEDELIEVIPYSTRSREVPLELEIYDNEEDEWEEVRPGASRYDMHVGRRRGYDPYFLGRSVAVEAGEYFVYSQDRTVRVRATDKARFYTVPANKDRRYI